MIINALDFGVREGVDNSGALMAMREVLKGKDKPHYVINFPATEIIYTDNRWLFGIQSFEIVNGVFRSIYQGNDDAMKRPFFVGEMLQDNVMEYIGTKLYVPADKFDSKQAGSVTITLTTNYLNQYNEGDRVLLYYYDQVGNGYPPGARYFEWNKIVKKNGSIITLEWGLKHNYSTLCWDNPDCIVGHPRIVNLDRDANPYCKQAIFTNVTFCGDVVFPAERLMMRGCRATEDSWFWPSENRNAVYQDMTVDNVEFDKLVGDVICYNVTFNKSPNGGGGVDRIYMNKCYAKESMRFNPRYLWIENTHIRSNTDPDKWVATLGDYPARAPIRRVILSNLTFSCGEDSLTDAHINIAPFNSLVNKEVSGKDIVCANFDLVKTMEAGTTSLFREGGSDGGLITSISYDEGKKGFIIKGNWNNIPVAEQVWEWCYVKEVIDEGGHRNLTDRKLWHGNSIRWKGNTSTAAEKEMHLNQDDFKWVKGGNGSILVDLRGFITSIELFIKKPYGHDKAYISIENVTPYKSILSTNTKSIGKTVIDNINSWAKQLYLNTYSISGDVTVDVLPQFDIVVKWIPF